MSDTSTIYTPVEAPVVPPRPFGLFSVAAPVPLGDRESIGVRWESIACGAAVGVTNDPCLVDMGETPDLDKALTAGCGDWAATKPYTVYVHAQMSPGGASLADAQERASELLTQGEQYGAELGLWEALVAAAAPVVVPALEGPQGRLAVVEQQLAEAYYGLGVIHMSPRIATFLEGNLERSGQQLQTKLGTPVVVGAGYDGDSEAIYGTGVVVVRRGVIESHPTTDRRINDLLALAERTYVVTWDCATVGATVAP
jgi:hypothetical protein